MSSIVTSPNRDKVVRLGKRALQGLYGDTPVPMATVRLLHRIGAGEDPLLPVNRLTDSAELHNRFLAESLRNVELGTWSIGAQGLNFLEQQIQRLKPQLVLEFGSGVSTVSLARYMRELHGDSERVYVVSVDQDAQFIAETVKLLEARQLARHARIFHAPLRQQNIEGVQALCYDMPAGLMEEAFAARQPDFVLVDGPAADHPARFGTLPLARRWLCPQTHFVLDDALRDGELQVAQLWSRLPYVTVKGLYLGGKGFLVGRVAGQAQRQVKA
jgi:predicted O-methyltransferase YrrM